jgi:hypothetical protein
MEIILCAGFGLFIGGVIGGFVWLGMEGVKGALTGIAVALAIALLCGGGMYLDTATRADKWNDGYCPECEIHWTPFGVSDTDIGSRTKYYYCEECYREIEL